MPKLLTSALVTLLITLSFTSIGISQIYYDARLIIGNPDSTPLHVPYEGVVNLPVWVDPIDWGSGVITLMTHNYAISERLGGNFYFNWQFGFSEPRYDSLSSEQALLFVAENCPDSLFHMADFTLRMNIDPGFIGDTLDVMAARSRISDSLGQNLLDVRVIESRLLIEDVTRSEDPPALPEKLILHGAHPNPFNAATAISFYLPEANDVSLVIYDITGRLIKSFDQYNLAAGEHIIIWDGHNSLDRPVSSGIYFYRLGVGAEDVTSRVVLQK